MCHNRLILLFAVSLASLFQVSSAYQSAIKVPQIASSSNEENQQHPAPEPYSFGYTAESNGGLSRHQESGDGSGRVTGFYTIMGDDGRERRVDYIADADGYRAQISTNEVGTRAQSSADANYQVQLPSAGQLEAAKISYEQYKYLEDTHATERQRVALQSNQKHAQSQQSLIDSNRQQQFNAGQTSTLQRGSSDLFQGGQQTPFVPASNNFVSSPNQGSNAGVISSGYGSLDDQNDVGWRSAKLLANRNGTIQKVGGGTADFSTTSSAAASTTAQGTSLINKQQVATAKQQYLADSGGRNVLTGPIDSNQGGQLNYQSYQMQQQAKQSPSDLSGQVNFQQQPQSEVVSQPTNQGRIPKANRNSLLQRQLEQQFLLQASGDQDYPRQTNGLAQQTSLAPSSNWSSSSYQATNAQAIGGQLRDENLLASDERPAIPKVVPQTITEQLQQQPQQQVSGWNQQAVRGSSYSTTGNERDYQQALANQQQGDNSAQFNYSGQFVGVDQEQANIVNQVDEKNEAQLQQEQQNSQIGQQQQTQVSSQQGVGITSRPAPVGLISINLNESSENQRQEEQEVVTTRPADKQISGLNFSFDSQVKNEQPLQQQKQQQQFNVQDQLQTVNVQPQQGQQVVQTQVIREPVQAQPIFKQTFSQGGAIVEDRPNSINQIIESITRQPILATSSEANQFRQEDRFEQRQQGIKGAPRPLGIQMRPTTTTTTTTTGRPVEPISEVLVTTNAPLFSRQEEKEEEEEETTTTARVTYYQPTTAPTTSSTSTTTARPTTTTTTTPAPTVPITRQTFVPAQRVTEITPSILVTSSRRPVTVQQQFGVKGGNKAPSPLAFKRLNKTSEFQYIQLPATAPDRFVEPERVGYITTITTRAPSRTTSLSQVNSFQRNEQAPYLSSTSNANLESSEPRPFVKYSNVTRGEARAKIQQDQVQQQQRQQPQAQYQQFQQQQPQSNYSQGQVNTVSQLSNEATYVTNRPSQPTQAVEIKQQQQQQQQPLKGTKGGYSSPNKRQFWQQQQQQKLVPTINSANQELARAMRSLTASVSYVDQEAQEHKQQPVSTSTSTTRKATLTSAEDYASLRGFGSRVLLANSRSF